MQITNKTGAPVFPDATQKIPGAAPARDVSNSSGGGAAQGDQVQISDTARAMAASDPDGDGDRTSAIMTKIASGAYNTMDSTRQVARAILRSGDLA